MGTLLVYVLVYGPDCVFVPCGIIPLKTSHSFTERYETYPLKKWKKIEEDTKDREPYPNFFVGNAGVSGQLARTSELFLPTILFTLTIEVIRMTPIIAGKKN